MNKTDAKKAIATKVQNDMQTTLRALGCIEFHKRRRPLTNELLERALHYFFDDTQLIQSYMIYKSVSDLCKNEEGEGNTSVSPLDEALWAAQKSAQLIQDSAEQEIVYAASLMYPCGLFMTDHPLNRYYKDPATPMQEERNKWRELMLEKSLNWLSREDETLGWLMRYLLEQLDHDAAVPAQWKPLRDAVLRGQVRIRAFW